MRMVLRGGAVVTGSGLLAGALGSVFVTRSLESMLVDVPRLDPVAYGVVVLLTLVALAACWIPASRATRVIPSLAAGGLTTVFQSSVFGQRSTADCRLPTAD